MAGPLSGIKVLDLSRVLAGPWSGQMLADLGADVIKVERPNSGDDTRHWGPPYLTDGDGNEIDAAYFFATNRGKRSIELDISSFDGAGIVRKLAKSADILIENFKVGGLAKYGLDYDSVSAYNPRLIYCSITGFGQDGPRAQQAGYDFMIQGMGGLMSVTGSPESGPQKVGVALADISTGMQATIAILAALHHRNQTGQGQYIDISLLETQVSVMANQNMNYLIGGQVPSPKGNAHPNIVPYQVFETANGHMILAVGNDHQFSKFAKLAGQEQWLADDRFVGPSNRVKHRDSVVPDIAAIMKTKTTDEWLSQCEGAGVPCGPVNSIEQALNDPQIKARGLVQHYQHPSGVSVPQVQTPIHYSETPLEATSCPPTLGQHTDAVLRDHGVSDEQIKLLREKGTIGK